MEIKLRTKFLLLFGLIVILFGSMALYSLSQGQKYLVESVGRGSVFLVDEMLKRISQSIYLNIEKLQTHSGHLVMHRAILKSNQEFEKLADIKAYLDQRDKEWVKAPKDGITPFMQELINQDLSKHFRREFIEFYQNKYGYKTIIEVFVTNKYGANIAQGSKTSDYRQDDEDWWQITKNKGFYVSPVEFDESQGEHAISICVRIDDEAGHFIGIMKAVVEIKSLIRSSEIALKKYETTRINLITSAGKLIYRTGTFNLLENVSDKEYFKQIQEDKGFFIATAGQREKLYSYARSKSYKDIESLGWILVMEHDAQEVLKPVSQLKNKMMTMALIVILLVILAAFLVALSVTEPVAKLTYGVKKITRGDLSHRVEIQTKGELGQLAAAFNQMAQKRQQIEHALLKAHDDLEIRVEERTSELASLNLELNREMVVREKAEERITHLNAVLLALREVNKLIVTVKDSSQLIQSACDNFIATRGYYNAWIALFDESGNFITGAEAGVGESFSQMIEMFKLGDMIMCCQKALDQSKVLVIANPHKDCKDCPQARAKSYIGREAMSIRLEYENKIYGILTVSIPKGMVTQGEELSLFEDVAEDIAFALYNIEAQKQRQATEKLLRLSEEKSRQNQRIEAIGTLAGGIAHDFNNILASILGYTELALDDIENRSLLEKDLKQVYTAGIRATDLVKQILTFARKSNEELRPVRIDIIAKEALKLLRASIPSTIEIRHNIKSDSMIMGDQTQVHQVLMNLYTNAAQAMDEEGGVLTVGLEDVHLEADFTESYEGLKPGDYLHFSVSDTGSGISLEIIESIFDPYFTTKAPDKGTGMGLATVHGIVKQYGGEIMVQSQVNKGSTFNVYLPITRKTLADIKPFQEKDLPSGTERILVIDDEPPIAKMTSQILKKLGYNVMFQTSSLEALEVFRSNPSDFDLIITDMTMPNMTGEKLAKELMKIRPDISIILCTGYSNKITDKTAADLGIKAFAYKPFAMKDLAMIVRKVLDEANS